MEYNVQDQDIWNMDEKGVMQGVMAKFRVMVSADERKKHMTQCGNREWVSLLECISMTGNVLRSWVIFKGVLQQKAWSEAFPEAHISTSEKGWTENEIYLWWIEQCFDKETSTIQKGEYRLLCVDGNASHISTTAIEYCIARKIIILCLPPHTTHLLQPLDVGVFAPLSIAYKNYVHRVTQLGACYSIDKVDFLKLYRLAKQDAITPLNIQKAWAATGLLPFDPQVVLKHFPQKQSEQYEQYNVTIRPTTPPEAIISYTSKNGETKIAITPTNTLQIQQLLRRATTEGIEQVEVLKKVSKAACLAMAERTIQSTTTNELLELNRRKERKTNRTKGNWGNARVLNQEVIDQRKADAADKFKEKNAQKALKEWNKEEKILRALGPELFAPSRVSITSRRRPQATQKSPPASLLRSISSPLHRRRMIVRLQVRVSIQELQQGRWSINKGQEQQGQEQGQEQPMGRGQGVKKPRKAFL